MNRRHVFWTLSRHASNCILLSRVSLIPGTPRLASSSTAWYFVAPFSRYSVKLRTIFTLIYFCLHSATSLHPTWNLWPASWGITIHRRVEKPTLSEPLHVHCRRQPIFIADKMFQPPTQPSSIVLDRANLRAIIRMKQDDDNTDREISGNESEHPGESTSTTNIEEDNLNNQEDVLHPDQACRDKTIWTTWVPLPKKWSRADTVFACTSLPNLRHPAGALAPPLLRGQKSKINISPESYIVQALPLRKAGGDHNVPQPKAGGGDHNVPQHQKATFEVATRFMEAIVFTKTPWPITSDGKYSMVDEAWQLAMEAQDHQLALAGATVGAPSVCQLPGGPSLKINPQTQDTVSVYSVFCSSIGLVMILNLKTYTVKTRD